jgi:prefoldin subunit 5
MMALEYVVGPVLALLVGMKFSVYKSKETEKTITELKEKVELLEKSTTTLESDLPKKMMATMLPVAKAVQKMNQQVGL